MEDKRSFVFYSTWLIDTEELSDEEMLSYLRAIIAYGLDGAIIPTKGYVKGLLREVRADIDDSMMRRELKAQANRENGKKGGRPRKETQMVLPENPKTHMVFSETQETLNVNVNDNVNEDIINKINSFLEKTDAEHNVDGLVTKLRDIGIKDKDIVMLIELSDCAKIGHKIWSVLYNSENKNKTISTAYILKCLQE